MTSSLQQMIAQKEALEQQIANATAKGKSEAITQVKALMSEHGLTMSDFGVSNERQSKKKLNDVKVVAKYRDPSTGETWSGRGLLPRWLKSALTSGKEIGAFSVQKT